jgi:hypothetical protein
MDWIKNNPFVAALSGGTLIICIGLFIMASAAGSKFDKAKEDFDTAYRQVSKSERIPLYPTTANRDAKKKALDDYRESIDKLRSLFDDYRVDEIEAISTQDFTERLKAANKEVSKAFKAVDCKLPDGFFMGFEKYRKELADSQSAGLLDYQVAGLKHALLDLAEARPTELISVYREDIPEESGGKFTLDENQVARKFGYEIVFKAPEDTARKFISALGDVDPHYYIIRTISIQNEEGDPPRVSDAKFQSPVAENEAEQGALFGDNFFDNFEAEAEAEPESEPGPDGAAEDGEPAVEGDAGEPVEGEEKPAAEQPAPEADSSKILAQVLGGEELLVFVRFDHAMFMPVETLPKP